MNRHNNFVAEVSYGTLPMAKVVAKNQAAITNPALVPTHPVLAIYADIKAPMDATKFPLTHTAPAAATKTTKASPAKDAEAAAKEFVKQSISAFSGSVNYVIENSVIDSAARMVVRFVQGIYMILASNEKNGGVGFENNTADQKLRSALGMDSVEAFDVPSGLPILGEAVLKIKEKIPEAISADLNDARTMFSKYLALYFIRPVMAMAMKPVQGSIKNHNVISELYFKKQYNLVGKSLGFVSANPK